MTVNPPGPVEHSLEAWAGDPLALTVAERNALESSPQLAAAAKAVLAARARVEQARAPWWPTLQWTTLYNHTSSQTSTQVVPNLSNAVPGGTATVVTVADATSSQLALRQTLFDFERRRSSLTAVEQSMLAALEELEKVRQDVLLQVRQAYYATITAHESLSIRRRALAAREQRLRQAEGFYRAGLRARIEVARALSDLAAARLDVVRADNALQTAWVALNVAMGRSSATRFTLTLPPEAGLAAPACRPEDLLATAWEQRPEILGLRARARAAAAQLRGLYASRMPTLSSNATFSMQGRPFPMREAWTVGLTIDWNLFDGFATRSQVAETRYNLEGLQQQIAQVRLQVYSEVETGRLNLEESSARLQAAAVSAEAARQGFELARQRYAVGLGSNLEYTDAQVAWVQAETDRINAQNDVRTNTARLARATGAYDLEHLLPAPGEGKPSTTPSTSPSPSHPARERAIKP